MTEINKDFMKFVVEVIMILIVLAALFGEEGIASNTFYYLLYAEPILLQNWLVSSISVGSYSPGDFIISTQTTGQAYTIKIYKEGPTTFLHVIPPADYNLQAKFATIKPSPLLSNCRIFEQEIKLKKGIKQTITVRKIINADGKCNVYVGAPSVIIEKDRYPHVDSSIDKQNPQLGDTFIVTLKYSHDKASDGGVHLHWPDNQADLVSVEGCNNDNYIYYNNAWNPLIMKGNELVECGKGDDPMIDGSEIKIELTALVNDIDLYYRAWDWSKDADCLDERSDHDRAPLSGICSKNCENFPDDLIDCETLKRTV